MAGKLETLLRKFRLDYETFAKHALKIQTKDAKMVSFVFNRMQIRLWARMQEDMKSGKPIRWIIVKGRQMGSSTWIAGLFFWLTCLRPNKNAIVAAHKEDAANELFRKQQLFLREMPKELRPMVKINNRGHLYFANPDHRDDTPGLESQIKVDVASNVDMGRAFALHLMWWSEYAMTQDPHDTMASVEQSLPNVPGTIFVIETTAKGPGPLKDLWDDEKNDFQKIFICWVASDEYRIEISRREYLELYDVEHDIYGNEIEEQERIIDALKEWYPDESQDDSWLAHESQCRLAWRRWCIDVKCKGDLTKFRQEYPTIADDAFLGSANSVFNQYKLSDMKQRLRDLDIKPKTFRFNFAEEEFYPARYGPIRMFEPFYPGATYVIGADPARGIKGRDPSAAVLLRCPDMIVAGVIDEVIPPDDFAVLLYHWGIYHNNALLGVEANEEGGFAVNRILAGRMDVDGNKYRYPCLYRRDVSERARTTTTDDLYGWATTRVSKDLMLTDLNSAIESDELSIMDIPIIDQLMKYQEIVSPTGNKRTGVPYPGHDDLAVALCVAYQMATRAYHQTKGVKKRVKKWSMDWWGKVADSQGSGHRSRFDSFD